MKKRYLCTLFIIMSIILISTCYSFIFAKDAQTEDVSYINVDVKADKITYSTKTQKDCIKVFSNNGNVKLEDKKWYVIDGNITVSGEITVDGNEVYLILKDNSILTAVKGIKVANGKKLNIYSESLGENMGKIIANNLTAENQAGIGGDGSNNAGNIHINGGYIEATGNTNAAGIGGGYNKTSGHVEVNAGTVLAIAGIDAPRAIGAGKGKDNVDIKIAKGLTVMASTNYTSEGIAEVKESDGKGNKYNDLLKDKKYVLISHVHDFTYTASGDKIVAKCTKDGCYLSTENSVLELVAEDATYDGKKYTGAKVSGDSGMISGDALKIYYIGVSPTVYASSTVAPTDAGKYKAKIFVDQNVFECEFEIKKADAKYEKKPEVEKNLAYNGEEQKLVTSGDTNCGVILFKLSGDANYTPSIPTKKDAGEYTVYYMISGDKNHKDSESGEIAASIGKREITITADDFEKNFGSGDENLTWKTTEGNIVNGDILNNIKIERVSGEAVGEYVITVSVSGDEDNPNYDITCESGTYTINPRVRFYANGGIFEENSGDTLVISGKYDEKIGKADIKRPIRENYKFATWCTDDKTTITWNQSEEVVDNLDLYARWVKLSNTLVVTVSGEEGATVELKSGNNLLVSGVTGLTGVYTFTNVPNGNYRIIVTKGTRMIEEAITIEENLNYTIELPTGNTKAIVEVSGDVHDTTVKGLNDLAKEKESGDLDVSIILNVEEKNSGDKDAVSIKAIAGNKEIEFIDVTITCVVSGESEEQVRETSNILEINIEYPTENKNIYVYRTHSGDSKQLKRIYSRQNIADGTYIVNDGYITIFASKFSTYGIASTDEEETTSSKGSRHDIIVEDKIKNGKLQVSSKSERKGRTITITAVPNSGYEVSKVLVEDSNGNAIKVTDKKNNKYTFVMPSRKVYVSAKFEKATQIEEVEGTAEWVNPYIDVKENNWFYDAVKFASENGLFNGTSSNTFSPNMNMTREMIVTVFYRYAKESGMDVSVGEDTNILSYDDAFDISEYAVSAIQWACGAGILNGRTEITLVPQGTVTREEFVTILYRFIKLQGKGFKDSWMFLLEVNDRAAISSWAYEPICWCYMNGIIEGRGNNIIDPAGLATRAEVATMIMRFLSL